mmetsp:Transcript_17695/g.39232  ORF Transcript_17695/g.39232 Transcript_17695/m.39232 type:complete len:448 (-) Transcript_17695:153-1496(-)
MKPFNDETKAEFEKQTVPKKYREVFVKSIEIAVDEVKKDKEGRVSWHYFAPPYGVPAEPVQRKRGRLKKTPLTEESGERRVAKKKVVKLKRDGEDGDEDEKAKEEEEEEEDGAQEEADGDESKYEFDEDVPRQGKRGHLSKNNTAEKKKIALSSSSNSPPKKRGRPSKNPLAYASDKPRVLDVTPVTAVGTIMKKRQEERQSALFLEESVMDRLVRFCNILKVTSVKEGDGSDIPRTVKILDKLPQMKVTGNQLIKSGIGRLVAELRKHLDSGVSSRASQLRTSWKEIVMRDSEKKKQDSGQLAEAHSAASITRPAAGSSSSSTFITATIAAATTGVVSDAALANRGSSVDPAARLAISSAPNPFRSRAMRLLRETVENVDTAFELEKVAYEVFGLHDSKYFRFITRVAFYIKKQLSEPSMKEQIFRDGMGVWLSECVSAGMKMVAQ